MCEFNDEADKIVKEEVAALVTDYERGRAAGLAKAVKVVRDQISKLTESLSEGLMTDAGLTDDDRKAMKAQLDCLGVFEVSSIAAIHALSTSPDHVLVPREKLAHMAKQKLSSELTEDEVEHADWQGAYESMVSDARAMIAEVK